MSADSIVSDNSEEQKSIVLKYLQERLNLIEAGSSLSEHEIKLKKGFMVILLRNIRLKCGLVNGTRYVVINMMKNLLFLQAVSGTAKGNYLVLPRMNCIPGMDDFAILGFRRRQFPIRVCFAMKINKTQAQSVLSKLGIDLSSSCFAHGHLYVTLSRATHPENVFVCLGNSKRKTRNVVYPEVLSEAKIDVQAHTPRKSHAASPICNIGPSVINREQQVTRWGAEFDSGSDYDATEKYRDLKKRTDVNGSIELNKVCHRNNHLQKGVITNFELLYGSIPGRISCSGISLTKNDILTVQQPRSWVIDTPISAFMLPITKD